MDLLGFESFLGNRFGQVSALIWLLSYLTMVKDVDYPSSLDLARPMFGENWSITGQDPSVFPKSNQLHVDIFSIYFLHLFELYSICSWVNFLKSRPSTGYFSNSTGSSATSCRFSPNPTPGQAKSWFRGLRDVGVCDRGEPAVNYR